MAEWNEDKSYPATASEFSLVTQYGKESAWKAGDLGLIPGLGRSPGEGNGYPFQWWIPWTKEPGQLQSMVSQRVDMTEKLKHTESQWVVGLWLRDLNLEQV